MYPDCTASEFLQNVVANRRAAAPACHHITAGVALQGLEAGLLVGVILCALHFAYEYSLMQLVSLTVLPSRSHAMLPFRYQQVLALFKDHVTAVSVSGVTLTLRCFCVSDSSAHLVEPS